MQRSLHSITRWPCYAGLCGDARLANPEIEDDDGEYGSPGARKENRRRLLSFPVTHFTQDFAFDEGPYREHIEWLLKHDPAGLFAAGGTGEFFSLTMPEFDAVVSAAVNRPTARVPVVAGCGYGTAIAKQFAKAAEAAGADGILLLPPYLVNSEPSGLMAHVEAVCALLSLESSSTTATTQF